MMKKRILSALLALCLCLSLGVTAFAAGTVIEVTQPETLPAVGETFTVTVSISGNTGFNAAQLMLKYDDAVVECTSADTGKVLSGALSATNEHATNPTAAIIAAATTSTIKSDGTLATFAFKVLKSGDAGFSIADLSISDLDGNDLALTCQVNGKVVTLETDPVTEPDPAEPDKDEADEEESEKSEDPEVIGEKGDVVVSKFSDVKSNYWAASYIVRASELGLVDGYPDGTFRPTTAVTRAQFVTMLWRLAGKPAATKAHSFTDVKAAWCADAIAWAAEKGYVKGITATTFQPDGNITREQAMAVLFRYSGSQSGMELMLGSIYDSNFTDSDEISAYAKSAVYWGVYQCLMSGKTSTTLAPKASASRAEIAAIFLRYYDKFISQEGTGK